MGHSLRDELLAMLQLQRNVILDLCDRVERLEMRADGLMPMERVERRWAKAATGDKLDRLIAEDREADRPAVPEGQEPAAVVGKVTWQPIRTAPQDGTEILASDYDAIEIVNWGNGRGGWMWYNREGHHMLPAWWQPLPDQPLAEQEPADG